MQEWNDQSFSRKNMCFTRGAAVPATHRNTLRLFVPLLRAEKKIRGPDWMAFFAPFGEYNMRVAKCRITLRVGTCV